MEIGLVGLGKMGINLAQNMLRHQHKVVGFDLNNALVEKRSVMEQPERLR